MNQYLLGLARYDVDYDVRDRARFLRALTIAQGEEKAGLNLLKQNLKDILLSNNESPVIESGTQGIKRNKKKPKETRLAYTIHRSV